MVNIGGTSLSGMIKNREIFTAAMPGVIHLRHTWMEENKFTKGQPEHGAHLADDLQRFVAIQNYFVPQGVSADMIASKYGYSRDDVDAYSVESQNRAKAAWDENRFDKSITPVKDINGLTILDHDEFMRPETTMQSLGSLDTQ